MKELAVLGSGEFTLGFRLTGIKRVIASTSTSTTSTSISSSLGEDFHSLLNNQQVGIIITDEATMTALPEDSRELAISSIDPVVVVVSPSAGQDELRKMIIRSIGVDLLKEEAT